MISLQQIRAARGLMNWSQSELAKNCGLSVTAMNNIDRGSATPRLSTIETICNVFEGHGIEFTEGHGVRLKDEVFRVQSYEGEDAISRYFDDVISTLQKNKTGEALHTLADETPYLQTKSQREDIFQYYMSLKKLHLRERILLAEGVMERYGSPQISSYRWCSKELASQIGTTVCGDKYYIFLPDKIIVIENSAIADAYRKQFEVNWNRSRLIPPAKSIFEEEYKKRKKAGKL